MATKKRVRSNLNFNSKLDEMLIQLVFSYPCLYDHGHEEYTDLNHRRGVWETIGSTLNRPDDYCKTRWRSIKDTYYKKKKLRDKGISFGSWPYMMHLAFLDKFLTNERRRNTLTATSVVEKNGSDPRLLKQEIITDRAIQENNMQEVSDMEEISSFINGFSASCSKKSNLNLECSDFSPPAKMKKETDSVIGLIETKIEDRLQHILQQKITDLTESKDSFSDNPTKTFFSSMAQTVIGFPPALAAEAKLKVCQVITELECHAQYSEQ